MSYYNDQETGERIEMVKGILRERDLDLALVYYDELNIANGWYLTGWCPQFESGAVVIRKDGDPMILGGPESEPFARMNSAITNTRNFTAFMVPDEEYPNATIIGFKDLLTELQRDTKVRRIGVVGIDVMPHGVYVQLARGFDGVELVDITENFVMLRRVKSQWEIQNITTGFGLSYKAYQAMRAKIADRVYEYEVAAAGEEVVRRLGASGFGFTTIVGSGERANAVVPTALNRQMEPGELVMVGLAPKWNGYCGVMGDTLPVSGTYTQSQQDCMNHLHEAFRLTKARLEPGTTGKEIDAPARDYYRAHGLFEYLVCPFVHTIGLNEAEAPFFGPNSVDELKPDMTVCIDVSFFGHPKFNGARIETGYLITESGCTPLCPEMDAILTAEV